MIILASGSPRRKELLSTLYNEYTIVKAEGEEITTQTLPAKIVEELSAQKAAEVFDRVRNDGTINTKEDNLIIAADTLVFIGNERMGKPKDKEDAKRMLKGLSGNVHYVYTGVTLVKTGKDKITTVSFNEKTAVSVYELTDAEIDEYIESGEPMDKAGAYAIQGLFGKYIKGIEGEYGTVVGLPVARLYHEISKLEDK